MAATSTIVVGQYVSFDRESDENILVAGVDLTRVLGYETPKEQQERARAARGVGVPVEQLLGDDVQPRSWVLSDDCKSLRRSLETILKDFMHLSI